MGRETGRVGEGRGRKRKGGEGKEAGIRAVILVLESILIIGS